MFGPILWYCPTCNLTLHIRCPHLDERDREWRARQDAIAEGVLMGPEQYSYYLEEPDDSST